MGGWLLLRLMASQCHVFPFGGHGCGGLPLRQAAESRGRVNLAPARHRSFRIAGKSVSLLAGVHRRLFWAPRGTYEVRRCLIRRAIVAYLPWRDAVMGAVKIKPTGLPQAPHRSEEAVVPGLARQAAVPLA